MTSLYRQLTTGVLLFSLLCLPAPARAAQTPAAEDPCREALIHIREQDAEHAKDLRRLHRELAALRNELEQPGLEEIFSGIGYILGLFGVGFYMAGRRRRQE